jgi:hypothetical protein
MRVNETSMADDHELSVQQNSQKKHIFSVKLFKPTDDCTGVVYG